MFLAFSCTTENAKTAVEETPVVTEPIQEVAAVNPVEILETLPNDIRLYLIENIKRFDIKQPVFEAIIEWDSIVSILVKTVQKFEHLSKYPEVSRDLAVIVDENLKFEDLKLKIEQQGNKILKKIDLFDIFRDDKKIGEHKKSYALSFVLQDNDKTLIDKEIDKFVNKTIRLIEKEFNAEIRM